MDANEYQIKTRWWIKATAEEIAEITQRPEDLMRWWSAAWLDARLLTGEVREGSEFECHLKGWLPYTLRFRGRVEVAHYARRCRIVTWGDFDGTMDCEIHEEPPYCEVCFDWRVRVQKAIVRRFSFCFKILFWTNHIWIMRKGIQGMRAELARHRAECGYSYSRASINGPETADCAGHSAATNAEARITGSSRSANPTG